MLSWHDTQHSRSNLKFQLPVYQVRDRDTGKINREIVWCSQRSRNKNNTSIKSRDRDRFVCAYTERERTTKLQREWVTLWKWKLYYKNIFSWVWRKERKKKSLFSSSLFGFLRALSLFFHVFRVVRFDVSFSSRRSLAGVVHAEISLARAYNFGSLESSEAPHRAFPRFSLSYAMLFEVWVIV